MYRTACIGLCASFYNLTLCIRMSACNRLLMCEIFPEVLLRVLYHTRVKSVHADDLRQRRKFEFRAQESNLAPPLFLFPPFTLPSFPPSHHDPAFFPFFLSFFYLPSLFFQVGPLNAARRSGSQCCELLERG